MSDRPTRQLAEHIVGHPIADHALPVALCAVVWALRPALPEADRTAFLLGVTTASALVMTAATFACALTYQSSNVLMTRVRDVYRRDLRRNWTSIIGGAFAAAIAPVFALLLPVGGRRIGILIGVYAAALVTARMARALFWLMYTLFAQELDDIHPPVALPPLQRRQTRSVTPKRRNTEEF